MTMTSAVQALATRAGIQHPIIQAPMAGTSTPKMAAAVSNAGGMGSIGVGAMTVAAASDAIKSFRDLSQGALNVNVFCHRPAVPDSKVEQAWLDRLRGEFSGVGVRPPERLKEIYKSFVDDQPMFELLLASRPRVVSFHFGLPKNTWLRALQDAGILLFATATNLAEARVLVAAGVDAIVAQGYEAGGHRGVFDPNAHDDELGTLALTRLIVREVAVPVISAGGIMDGNGVAAAIRLGAAAAQLGTAFVPCDESAADEGYRSALFSDAAHHTVMTRAISGRPARCLANKYTSLGLRVEAGEIPSYPIAYDAGKSLNAAAKASGDFGYGAQWAGQGAPLARHMSTAKLVDILVSEFRQSS